MPSDTDVTPPEGNKKWFGKSDKAPDVVKAAPVITGEVFKREKGGWGVKASGTITRKMMDGDKQVDFTHKVEDLKFRSQAQAISWCHAHGVQLDVDDATNDFE